MRMADMLTEKQIEAIAQAWYEKGTLLNWDELGLDEQLHDLEQVRFIASKAIADQSDQDRRSFTAVGKYIGVRFTSETDVVSEVYMKLEEIMSVFRENSQEIAIAQQIKHLNKQLERYLGDHKTSDLLAGTVGDETGRPLCVAGVSEQALNYKSSRKSESFYGVVISSAEYNKSNTKIRVLFHPGGKIDEVMKSRLDFAEKPAAISAEITTVLQELNIS